MSRKQKQENVANRPPVCKAILLCDDVSRDPATAKTTISGIFDTFIVPSFPGSTSPCKLFLFLAEASGRWTISAQIQDPSQGVILFKSPGAGEFGDPEGPGKGELCLPVSALRFERAGTYDMVVFAGDNEIGRLEFNARTRKDQPDVASNKK
ncbi:MAG: DUF6941 family protein [Isosphaerales bacterium]